MNEPTHIPEKQSTAKQKRNIGLTTLIVTLIIAVAIFLYQKAPTQFESVTVSLFTWSETRIPDNLPTPERPPVDIIIEQIPDESGNLPPAPLHTSLSYVTMEDESDMQSLFTFTTPGTFTYRLTAETPLGSDPPDGLTRWENTFEIYYYTFTVTPDDGYLTISTSLIIYDEENNELFQIPNDLLQDVNHQTFIFYTFSRRYTTDIIDTWEHGTGMWLQNLHSVRKLYITDSRIRDREDEPVRERRHWELTDDRQLKISRRFGDEWDIFDITLTDEHLILTDTDGNVRTYWREDTRPLAEEPFLGTWHFVHGQRFNWRRTEEVTFTNHFGMLTSDRDPAYWEPYSANQLLLPVPNNALITWELDETQNILTLTRADGGISVWQRAGTTPSLDESWLITDYLDDLDIASAHTIVHNHRQQSEIFEFILYEIESQESPSQYFPLIYHLIVVKKDDQAIDVINTQFGSWQMSPHYTIHDIYEIDLNFNGEMDIVLNHGYIHSGCSANVYSGFIYQDGALHQVFTQRCGFFLNFDQQLIGHPGGQSGIRRLYRFEGLELTHVGTLDFLRLERREDHGNYYVQPEHLLIDGQWQESTICFFTPAEYGHDWRRQEPCDGYDEDLYRRIRGEGSIWNFWENENWLTMTEASVRGRSFITSQHIHESLSEFTFYRTVGEAVGENESHHRHVTIQIKQNGEVLQVFDDLTQFFEPGTRRPFEEETFEIGFADFTGNGYLDMTLVSSLGGSAENLPSYFWLWDREAGKFVRNEALEFMSSFAHVTAIGEGCVVSRVREGTMGESFGFHQYVNGEFIRRYTRGHGFDSEAGKFFEWEYNATTGEEVRHYFETAEPRRPLAWGC